jgi:curved DNA-binding protein CbpA
MDPELDPYRVLDVDPTASLLDIARARRRLAKLHHPDLAAGEAADEMSRINAAWTLLADADARAAWDRAHRLAPAGTAPPATTWMEWAYPPPAPRSPSTPGSGGNTAWWVLGAFLLFLIVIVGAGIVSTLDRPADLEIAPWLQDNLDR